ncbi:DMT family transporter [Candidatus Similichlamydia laticola]|uniref:EamA domain-containing protein n=1 Tax=Candidatus Similichlamydia laticola TaxID=2170265 RepID=A0A369KKP5_9BACT|nr:DMT family transporter [Candidatus Similichlamydia laticola]RDB31576.1 hypothetical protein HAT2_00317 [Candidatus Similichlamydia laticola]
MRPSFSQFVQVLLAYAAIASSALFSRTALEASISPFLFVALRLSIAGTCLLLFQSCKKVTSLTCLERRKIIFLAFLQAFFPLNCEIWALQYVSIPMTQLLYNLTPFLTALLLCRRTRLSLIQWGCIAIACTNSLFALGASNSFSFPEIVMFLAVLSGAAGWIYFKKLLKEGHCPHFLNAAMMFTAGLLSWALCGFLGVSTKIEHPKAIFVALASSLFFSNFVFYTLYSAALQHSSPTFLALLGQFTPLFAAFYTKVWFGEAFPENFLRSVFVTIFATLLFHREDKGLWGRSDSN